MNEVEQYEASKQIAQTDAQYQLPSWYRRTFLWLWPYVLIGVFAWIVAPARDRPQLTLWWVGMLVWCAIFFAFFRRLE